MTKNLQQILTALKFEAENYKNDVVTNEKEFIHSIKELNKKLIEELEKTEGIPEIEV